MWNFEYVGLQQHRRKNSFLYYLYPCMPACTHRADIVDIDEIHSL